MNVDLFYKQIANVKVNKAMYHHNLQHFTPPHIAYIINTSIHYHLHTLAIDITISKHYQDTKRINHIFQPTIYSSFVCCD